MTIAAGYREIVSGRRTGLGAAFLRRALGYLEPLYRLEVARRNRAYDNGRRPVQRVAVPVISVGNLTTGGTGKTPVVAWLARWLTGQGRRVAIVSRGYGARDGQLNDEARELARQLPDVPHCQHADRVLAARRAIQEHACDVVLLDDAFQHRRIHRDVDLVVIDALEPFGYDHLLPRGMLREPCSALARATGILVSRANLVEGARLEEIHRRLRGHAPRAWLADTAQRPTGLWTNSGESETTLAGLRGVRVAAFCGLGNPGGFRETLRRCGVEIVDFLEFPDHFGYDVAAARRLEAWAASLDVACVLCTMKDLVKLSMRRLADRPLAALTIGVEFLQGEEFLTAQLARTLATFRAPDSLESSR